MADDKWSGQPVEITPGTPKDVAQLRKNLISTLNQGTKQGATVFPGQLSAKPNALTNNAGDMVSRMAGYGGYFPQGKNQLPPNVAVPTFEGSAGGGGTGGGGGYGQLPPGVTPLPTTPIIPGGEDLGKGVHPTNDLERQAMMQMLMSRYGGSRGPRVAAPTGTITRAR